MWHLVYFRHSLLSARGEKPLRHHNSRPQNTCRRRREQALLSYSNFRLPLFCLNSAAKELWLPGFHSKKFPFSSLSARSAWGPHEGSHTSFSTTPSSLHPSFFFNSSSCCWGFFSRVLFPSDVTILLLLSLFLTSTFLSLSMVPFLSLFPGFVWWHSSLMSFRDAAL